MKDNRKYVENTIPILPVKNLRLSVKFYTEKLDFKLQWESDIIAGIVKDGHHIMLQRRNKPFEPNWVWVGLHNDDLFNIYKDKDVTVVQEPQNHEWAYEMKFSDLDGNILWLATGPKKTFLMCNLKINTTIYNGTI